MPHNTSHKPGLTGHTIEPLVWTATAPIDSIVSLPKWELREWNAAIFYEDRPIAQQLPFRAKPCANSLLPQAKLRQRRELRRGEYVARRTAASWCSKALPMEQIPRYDVLCLQYHQSPGQALAKQSTVAPEHLGHRAKSGLVPDISFRPTRARSVKTACISTSWTVGLRDGRHRPVMVYSHGGADSSGSGNNALYDGVNLCRRGVDVVVTLNHRLNLFGFVYLAELDSQFADSGNAGMLDLVLALEWVRDNIAQFGGDPKRVLIFGQSGGGAKCATLMGMPAARGLFHSVITMSGQQITASRPETATERSWAVLAGLNLPGNRIDELRTMPMEQLIQASHAAGHFGPVKDGRSLVRDPFDPDAPPLSAGIAMILGNAHDETRLLIGSSDPTAFDLTWETLPAKLQQHAQFFGKLRLAQVIRQYRDMYPADSPSDIFFAATTASRSWRGQLIEAELRASESIAAARTWVYELDWRSPVDGGKWGAPHTLDIPLALDNTAAADGMTGDSAEARHLAGLISDAFIAFARTGNPNHADLPFWPTYNLNDRPTMSFNVPPRLLNDPRSEDSSKKCATYSRAPESGLYGLGQPSLIHSRSEWGQSYCSVALCEDRCPTVKMDKIQPPHEFFSISKQIGAFFDPSNAPCLAPSERLADAPPLAFVPRVACGPGLHGRFRGASQQTRADRARAPQFCGDHHRVPR